MAELALWLSAGFGRGVGKEPRATEGGFVLVSSTCCTVGPEVEPWIGSTVPVMTEMWARSRVASLVTASSELVRGGGWLTKTGLGEDVSV